MSAEKRKPGHYNKALTLARLKKVGAEIFGSVALDRFMDERGAAREQPTAAGVNEQQQGTGSGSMPPACDGGRDSGTAARKRKQAENDVSGDCATAPEAAGADGTAGGADARAGTVSSFNKESESSNDDESPHTWNYGPSADVWALGVFVYELVRDILIYLAYACMHAICGAVRVLDAMPCRAPQQTQPRQP